LDSVSETNKYTEITYVQVSAHCVVSLHKGGRWQVSKSLGF